MNRKGVRIALVEQFKTITASEIWRILHDLWYFKAENYEKITQPTYKIIINTPSSPFNNFDQSSKTSTPEVAFRLVCSPALLTDELSESTLTPTSEIIPKKVSSNSRKPPVIPRRRNRLPNKSNNSPYTVVDSSDSLSSDSELHSPTPGSRKSSSTVGRRVQSPSKQENNFEKTKKESVNRVSEDGDVTPVSYPSVIPRHSASDISSQQLKNRLNEHPLLPFAHQNFLNR
ncbi:unnamed protein product [Trichobilharzia regenti]|nr:unnamed protein product [Trichobilharzia regenti]